MVSKMKATQQLDELGSSLWLDNTTRDLLDKGTLERYIADLPVTGLSFNPTIFDHAITHSSSYDTGISRLIGYSGVGLFWPGQ
jgi:transaldolase